MGKKSATTRTILEMLDSLIEQHHLLKHPFYRAWTEGSLPHESLQTYAEQYYHHVRSFPENLKTLAARSTGNLAQIVEDNVAEELNPANPHPVLWRHFAHSLGVTDASLDSARPLPGIAALLDTYEEAAAQGSPAQAVACFYAYEAQVPEISTQKIAGLKRYYGVTGASALEYFAVHQEADQRHRAAWRNWLASEKGADSFGVLCAAERSLKALWGALDAVYPRAFASKN
jgi:pyrroloquinoline-quinone synthase